MKIGNQCAESYVLNLENSFISTRPMPMSDPSASMSPNMTPVCDPVELVGKEEIISFSMLKNDRYAAVIAIFGGREGVKINKIRVPNLPQKNAPTFNWTGIRADSGELLSSDVFEFIPAGRTGYIMLEVSTAKETEPGVYQTFLDIDSSSCDDSVTQIPLLIKVEDLTLNNCDYEEDGNYSSTLEALKEPFNAFLERRLPKLSKDNEIIGFVSNISLKLYEILKLMPENVADIFCQIVSPISSKETDESEIRRVRDELINYLRGEN